MIRRIVIVLVDRAKLSVELILKIWNAEYGIHKILRKQFPVDVNIKWIEGRRRRNRLAFTTLSCGLTMTRSIIPSDLQAFSGQAV